MKAIETNETRTKQVRVTLSTWKRLIAESRQRQISINRVIEMALEKLGV